MLYSFLPSLCNGFRSNICHPHVVSLGNCYRSVTHNCTNKAVDVIPWELIGGYSSYVVSLLLVCFVSCSSSQASCLLQWFPKVFVLVSTSGFVCDKYHPWTVLKVTKQFFNLIYRSK